MTKPKILVLRTAGTNCDGETEAALEKAGAAADRVHVNRIAENTDLLHEYKALVIAGGFSYGDDIAAGAVLANELTQRLGDELYRFRDDGKPILGICNGFQVLVKTGLLPGIRKDKREANLSRNDSGKFECRWTYLHVNGEKCIFTKDMEGTVYIPVAHAEGKFAASVDVMDELMKNGQVVFRYAHKNGRPANGKYPENPNGSLHDIAGICDDTGLILGMMPHPERHYRPEQHPQRTREGLQKEGDGLLIFKNAVKYVS